MTISRWVMKVMKSTGVAVGLPVLFGLCVIARPAVVHAGDLVVSGTWKSNVSDNKEGTWQLTGTSTNLVINGELTSTGPSDFGQGTILGALAQTGGIHFGVVYNEVYEATFDGTVTGGVASGTYTTKDDDAGSWQGSLGAPQ
jgi:hypothetical protein